MLMVVVSGSPRAKRAMEKSGLDQDYVRFTRWRGNFVTVGRFRKDVKSTTGGSTRFFVKARSISAQGFASSTFASLPVE